MTRFVIFILMILVALPSCKKEVATPSTPTDNNKDEDGAINSLAYLWEAPLHKDGTFYSNSIIKANLVFDDKVLVGTTDGDSDDNNWLSALDLETGEELWRWNDIYLPPYEQMGIRNYFVNQNVLAYVEGSRHYTINLDNGNTHWKIRRETTFDHEIAGFGNTYYLMGVATDTLEEYENSDLIFEGNLQTGELKRLNAIPDYSYQYPLANRIGRITGFHPFIHQSDTLMSIVYQETYYFNEYRNNNFVSYLGLYNITKDQWIYDKIQINEPHWFGVLKRPIQVVNDKVYMTVNRSMYCHDLWTGEAIWSYDFPLDLLISGFIVVDGKVIANSEDKKLYCMDAESGSLLWTGEGAGSSSPLYERQLNGILYFSGGSTSKIHAVDINTGKTVWRLDPSKIEAGMDDWRPDMFVAPGKNGEKGKVIALTSMHAYCFEAYQ